MTMMQWLLELLLTFLLAITLFQALRLQKALTSLRRDRAALEEMVVGFDEKARQAEGGIERLRAVADAAARQVTRQIDQAKVLSNDLAFLTERGEHLSEQLDRLLRHGQPALPGLSLATSSAAPSGPVSQLQAISTEPGAQGRSKAERDLLRVLRAAR